MSDMLDFCGDFWEDLIDCDPPIVDNNCIEGDLTYAAVDYLGVLPMYVWLPELRKTKAEWLRYIKSRTEDTKHYYIENR